jgi:UDP-N-acetylmuramate dehydrogenase
MTNTQQNFQNFLSENNLLSEVEYDRPLGKETYFKIGGPAEILVKIATIEELSKIFKWATANQVKTTILGGASNVLVADAGIKGLVIKLNNDHTETTGTLPDGKTGFLVGAATKTALAVRQSVELGLTGLEHFLGVPGTIGGAIYNNAHYLQNLIGDHVSRVQVVSLHGEIEWISQDDCEFAYEQSRFQSSSELIWAVEFALAQGNREDSLELIKKSTQYRAETQPLGEPSSGCIFQNVPNTPALRQLFPKFAEQPFVPGGFLIDQAGLKGASQGEIEVSHKHAAFFVNKGHGTATDVLSLIKIVKERVFAKFGVELTEEVFYLE